MITVGDVFNGGGRLVVPLVPKGKKNTEDSSASVTLSCEVFDLVSDVTSVTAKGTSDDDNLNNGVLTVLLAGVKGLQGEGKDLKTQVVVECGDKTFMSPVVMECPGIDANNPCYDSPYRVLLTPEIVAAAPDVKFTMKNMDKTIGEYTIPFEDLLSAPESCITSEFLIESGGTLFAKSYIKGVKKQA